MSFQIVWRHLRILLSLLSRPVYALGHQSVRLLSGTRGSQRILTLCAKRSVRGREEKSSSASAMVAECRQSRRCQYVVSMSHFGKVSIRNMVESHARAGRARKFDRISIFTSRSCYTARAVSRNRLGQRLRQ